MHKSSATPVQLVGQVTLNPKPETHLDPGSPSLVARI